MPPRTSAKRSGRKAKPAVHTIKVVKGNGELSPVERAAEDAFRKAVQMEYAVLAKKKLPTVVMRKGKLVRGVPKKVGGQYVVRDA
jgi:hypothetical protein